MVSGYYLGFGRTDRTRPSLPIQTRIDGMTSRADPYLEKAAHLESRAEEVKDPSLKQILLNLAKQWRDLARQVEGLEKNGDGAAF